MEKYKLTDEGIGCSVVVPFYNEGQVARELYHRLKKVLASVGLVYEIIFIDDGSSDDTLDILKSISSSDSHVTVIELQRNFGQTPALAAGFDYSRGDIIVAMDGDLQHLPEEIPHFLDNMDGYDVVSGWREKRVDNLVLRKIPSRVANWLAAKISGVDIHDFGTTFKAYRREVISDLKLYGEMHRFIPAILAARGVKIKELSIKNVERQSGKSNYGISRTFRVALDLITLKFLLGYSTRPLHFFGKISFYCFAVSFALSVYIMIDKLYYNVPILGAHGPMAMLAGLLILIGVMFVSTGLIAELMSRIYFEATDSRIYTVRKVHKCT